MKKIMLKDDFDSNRYCAFKSSNYPDKYFVFDINEYGRIISLNPDINDNREIKSYKIKQDGDIDFDTPYLITLNTMTGAVISSN